MLFYVQGGSSEKAEDLGDDCSHLLVEIEKACPLENGYNIRSGVQLLMMVYQVR